MFCLPAVQPGQLAIWNSLNTAMGVKYCSDEVMNCPSLSAVRRVIYCSGQLNSGSLLPKHWGPVVLLLCSSKYKCVKVLLGSHPSSRMHHRHRLATGFHVEKHSPSVECRQHASTANVLMQPLHYTNLAGSRHAVVPLPQPPPHHCAL